MRQLARTNVVAGLHSDIEDPGLFGSLKSKTLNKTIPKFSSKNLIINFEKNENCTTKFLFFLILGQIQAGSGSVILVIR